MVLEGNKGCNFRHVEFEFILDTQGKVGRLKFRELSQLEIRVWELSVQKWPFQAWAVEDQAGRESVGKRSEC